MEKLKLRNIGNSVGTVIPKTLLDKYGWSNGDNLTIKETPEGILITSHDPEFENKMMIARETMSKYRTVMEELAK